MRGTFAEAVSNMQDVQRQHHSAYESFSRCRMWCLQDERSIYTVLQKVRVSRGTSTEPDTSKQATAFPPNYIHSLDSTHMMMTALACKDAGTSPGFF